MMYKGINFRKDKNLLPFFLEYETKGWQYVQFGKIVPFETQLDKNLPEGAIPTEFIWNCLTIDSDLHTTDIIHKSDIDMDHVHVIPIPLVGHTRTNTAYGNDGRTYMWDGKSVYKSKILRKVVK